MDSVYLIKSKGVFVTGFKEELWVSKSPLY